MFIYIFVQKKTDLAKINIKIEGIFLSYHIPFFRLYALDKSFMLVKILQYFIHIFWLDISHNHFRIDIQSAQIFIDFLASSPDYLFSHFQSLFSILKNTNARIIITIAVIIQKKLRGIYPILLNMTRIAREMTKDNVEFFVFIANIIWKTIINAGKNQLAKAALYILKGA